MILIFFLLKHIPGTPLFGFIFIQRERLKRWKMKRAWISSFSRDFRPVITPNLSRVFAKSPSFFLSVNRGVYNKVTRAWVEVQSALTPLHPFTNQWGICGSLTLYPFPKLANSLIVPNQSCPLVCMIKSDSVLVRNVRVMTAKLS